MKSRAPFIILFAILLATPAVGLGARADPPAAAYKLEPGPFKVQTIKELVLRAEKQKKDLQLRINRPDGKGPFPIIVFSHGARGSKENHLGFLGRLPQGQQGSTCLPGVGQAAHVEQGNAQAGTQVAAAAVIVYFANGSLGTRYDSHFSCWLSAV